MEAVLDLSFLEKLIQLNSREPRKIAWCIGLICCVQSKATFEELVTIKSSRLVTEMFQAYWKLAPKDFR